MNQNDVIRNRSKILLLITSVTLLTALLIGMVAARTAFGAVASIATSTKSADKSTAIVGETIQYTVSVTNSSPSILTGIHMTDTLPAGLNYVAGSLMILPSSGTHIPSSLTDTSGTMLFTGAIGGNARVDIQYSAVVAGSATVGQTITNTANFYENGNASSDSAAVMITAPAANLASSTKTVDKSQASVGESVEYTVIISNTGPLIATNIFMTDTLPAGVTYVPSSLVVNTVPGTAIPTSSGESGGVIHWNGALTSNAQVEIKFDATVDATAPISSTIANTAIFQDGASSFNDSASFIVASTPITKYIYLPIVFNPMPIPTGIASTNAAEDPTTAGNYVGTVSWSTAGMPAGATYIIEESTTSDFSSNVTSTTSTGTSASFSHPPSLNNIYYYRVRSASGSNSSPASAVVRIVGAYRDDFSNTGGNWRKVREDFISNNDDMDNVATLTSNGHWKMHVRGQYDFFFTSSMTEAPPPPYKIKTRVMFEGPGNLNSYGIAWGVDGNGQACPSINYPFPIGGSVTTLFSELPLYHKQIFAASLFSGEATDNCFNEMYRAQVLWFGAPNTLRMFMNRINEFKDFDGTYGDRENLTEWQDFSADNPSGWNEWVIEVHADGTMNAIVNGTLVASAQDTAHINNPYFGLYAESNEYPGSDPLYDWIEVVPMP